MTKKRTTSTRYRYSVISPDKVNCPNPYTYLDTFEASFYFDGPPHLRELVKRQAFEFALQSMEQAPKKKTKSS